MFLNKTLLILTIIAALIVLATIGALALGASMLLLPTAPLWFKIFAAVVIFFSALSVMDRVMDRG